MAQDTLALINSKYSQENAPDRGEIAEKRIRTDQARERRKRGLQDRSGRREQSQKNL